MQLMTYWTARRRPSGENILGEKLFFFFPPPVWIYRFLRFQRSLSFGQTITPPGVLRQESQIWGLIFFIFSANSSVFCLIQLTPGAESRNWRRCFLFFFFIRFGRTRTDWMVCSGFSASGASWTFFHSCWRLYGETEQHRKQLRLRFNALCRHIGFPVSLPVGNVSSVGALNDVSNWELGKDVSWLQMEHTVTHEQVFRSATRKYFNKKY